MVDISPLKRYIETPDNFMIKFIPHEIERLGLTEYLTNSIRLLNASKVWDDGLRPVQTISYIYIRAITEIVYTINNYVEENDKDKWFTILLEQHEANLEYEKENPPIDYDTKRSNKTKAKPVGQSTPRRRKDDKPSAAELKLASKVAKLNMLNIKIKK